MWDLDPADLIDMAADRGPFVDQSQSLTLGIRHPTPALMVRIIARCALHWHGTEADCASVCFAEGSYAACVACRFENWVILSPYVTSGFYGVRG